MRQFRRIRGPRTGPPISRLLIAIIAAWSLWIATGPISAQPFVVNTTTFNSATFTDDFNAAIAAADAGTVFEVQAGNYILTDTLRLKSGITLRGAGPTTVFQADHNKEAIVQLLGQAAAIPAEVTSNVTVENLTIDGGGGDGQRNIYGFQAWGESGPINNIRVAGLTILNIGADSTSVPDQFGIFFTNNVTGSVIEYNDIQNINPTSIWAAGIRVAEGSSNNTIQHNKIDSTGRGGILTNNNSTDLRILHNKITKSGLAVDPSIKESADLGIELFGGNDRSVVQGNTVDRWISVDASDEVAVRNNTVTGDTSRPNTFTGLEVVNSERFVFRENSTAEGIEIGVSVSGDGVTRYGLIDGNKLADSNQFGIQVQGYDNEEAEGIGSASQLVLINNMITGSNSDAIRLNLQANDLLIQDNTLTPDDGFDLGLSGNSDDFDDIVISGDTTAPEIDDTDPESVVRENRGVPIFSFAPDEDLVLQFTDQRFDEEEEIALVLWDTGAGVPFFTQGLTLTAAELQGTPVINNTIVIAAWNHAGESVYAIAVVPEPTSALAAALGAGLIGWRRKFR